MTSQVDAINAALATARAAAAQAAPATAQVPAVANASAPTAVAQAGPPVSMRQMVTEAGIRPDAYLKVTPFGFNVGKDTKTVFDELPVEFRITQAKPFYGLRYGNPAKYLKSYDRKVESKSRRDWATVTAEASAADPRCTGDYPALDLLMTATADIKAKDGSILLEKGKTLGWTSSITNWTEWASFIEPIYQLIDLNIVPPDTLVAGKIKHLQRSGNGNTWGLVSFEDIQVADLGEAGANTDESPDQAAA